MYLLILEDGSVKYKRLARGATTEITGPIKEFQGDSFVVGVAFIKTTFEVSKPPYQENGVWHMVVDGITLTRTNTSAMDESDAETEADDTTANVFLGQLYPSGNSCLRSFDETANDAFFWSDHVKYSSLISDHAMAAKVGDASLIGVASKADF